MSDQVRGRLEYLKKHNLLDKHSVSASGSNELLCGTLNFKLPCDVVLEGGGKISKGCKLSTLILALENRARYGSSNKLCDRHGGIGFVSCCVECNT
jgi:hypothetical protein